MTTIPKPHLGRNPRAQINVEHAANRAQLANDLATVLIEGLSIPGVTAQEAENSVDAIVNLGLCPETKAMLNDLAPKVLALRAKMGRPTKTVNADISPDTWAIFVRFLNDGMVRLRAERARQVAKVQRTREILQASK